MIGKNSARKGEKMKRLFMLIPLVFLCCLGCQQGEEPATVDVEADIQAIKDSVAELESAVNAGDTDRGLALYADDAIEIRPNEPAAIGKEAIQRRGQQDFNEFALQDVYEVKGVKVSGDLGVAHLAWSTAATPKAGGEPIKAKGNWIRVYERQSDGSWKCIYSIWSDENLVIPPATE
jgi:uncharacterized protein (TIGR02246 family)